MAPTDLPAFPLWLESVGRYLMAAGPDPTEWIQSVHALVRSYDFGIHHVIRAIHKTSYSGVREFHVLADDGLDGEPGVSFTMTAFNSLSVQQHRAAAYLFRGLSKLELNFSSCLIAHDETVFSLHHHSGERRQQLAQLAALLKGAKSLTELGLHFSDRPGLLDDIAVFTMFMYQHELEDDPPRCLLTWIGFDTTWPKLRSLTLTGAFTVEDTLVAFIKRHAATLHQVKFNYCCLMVGTWANFVDEAVSRPSIHAFTLNGVHEYATPGEEENITRMEKSTRAELLYRGAIEIDAEGHRYFKSTSTRSVYVTRNDSGSL
ncbi:uncharacterized protein EI97DRAFT_53975 [Westerdykella ornata]|uniref:Uncharacterized protein n=1 Tax=Westerdykella ornata TaxID=318751 RepID=A0A6A6JJ54_WESOR|nr:uncharacterized protein EI97DRAFT_53975 [Westerdykella ornata]KAF2276275.1 hypothetical protein EI97DRAFT_53975 [Westerdykella ornata]